MDLLEPMNFSRIVPEGRRRHPWEEEPRWDVVLDELELDALELLVDLECGAEDLWRLALETMGSELELDPGLSLDYESCRQLGPWAWLRSTPLYLSLEREIGCDSDGDAGAEAESLSPVLGTR